MTQAVLRIAAGPGVQNRAPGSAISWREIGSIQQTAVYYIALFCILISGAALGVIFGYEGVYSWSVIGIICGGPLAALAACQTCGFDQRHRAFWAGLVIYCIAAPLFAGQELVAVLSVKPAGMRLATAFYETGSLTPFGAMAGALALGVCGRLVFGANDGFKRARAAALGDARWLSMGHASQLFPPDGEIVIGETYRPDQERSGHAAFDPKDKESWGSGGRAPLLTYNLNFDSTHMLFFAGSGGFKTTSTVVPTALRFTGSMVVLDPACEVGGLVAARRRSMGRKVVLLDPSAVSNNLVPSVAAMQGCNVLLPLLASKNAMADTVAFARLLVAESAKSDGGSSEYFASQAHNLMTGLLFYVIKSSEFATGGNPDESGAATDAVSLSGRPTLRHLRALTSLSEKELRRKIEQIVSGALELESAGTAEYAFVKETLSPYVSMAEQTWTGIASSVAKDTQWLSIPTLAALVCNDKFRPAELLDGNLDVFIQIPGDLLKSYPGIGRTLVGAFSRTMMDAKGKHKKRVLMVLDEVDLLGYMGLLEEIRDRGRKYGLTLMLMYQSVGQLEKHFGKEGATSWFEGCSFASYASIKSMDTAKSLSAQCGEVTVEVEGRSASSSWLDGLFPARGSQSNRVTASVSLQKRPLILPHEVREMRSDEQIIMVRGYPALRAGRAIYFRRPEMASVVSESEFK